MERKYVKSIAIDFKEPSLVKKRILLIHGASSNGIYWKEYAHLFYHAGYAVYVVHLRGHEPYVEEIVNNSHLQDYILDVQTVCHDIEPDIIIGHSLGGLIAQLITQHLTSIEKLILMSPAPSREIFEQTFFLDKVPTSLNQSLPLKKTIQLIHPFVNRMLKNIQMGLESFFTGNYGAQSSTKSESPYMKNIPFFPESPYILPELFSDDNRVFPAQITCPILLVYGGKDVITPAYLEKKIIHFLKAEEFYIPRAGHMYMLDPLWKNFIFLSVLEWIENNPSTKKLSSKVES